MIKHKSWCDNLGSQSAPCYTCDATDEPENTFAGQMNRAWAAMEERVEELEAAVKRLNRELGIK
jgi:hypothetical protein